MTGIRWPDARGWIGIGVYSLSVMVLWMYAFFPDLRQDDHFKALMTLIVGTGFINAVVSWAYAATKGGGELAERNASLVERQASTPTGMPTDPISTKDAP